MGINWEVIVWCCVTITVIVGTVGTIFYFISAKNMRARRAQMQEIHTKLAIGSQVIFAGGLYGRVVAMDEETLNVELAKGAIIKISRFAVQELVE